MFRPTSRYYGIDSAMLTFPDGREVVYVRRRFLPPAMMRDGIVEHPVTEGDRLDNITARYLGDPEQFWRLCDDNNAMRPNDLISEIGRRLGIPVPQ